MKACVVRGAWIKPCVVRGAWIKPCVVRGAWCVAMFGVLGCQARANNEPKSGASQFNGRTAFTYIEKQMSFGPRIPNKPGHEQTGDWLLAELRARADTVIVQDIRHVTHKGDTLHLRNFFARFRPQAPERVLFLAHWDTRPMADRSMNVAQQRMPVPGANDGASGVAVLLGVADVLKAQPPANGVDLLFVDGEDYGDFADTNDVLIGSRWFGAHRPPGYQPLFAVLFDMVADKDRARGGAAGLEGGGRSWPRTTVRVRCPPHAHRRSCVAAEGRDSRHRRRGFRLPVLAHDGGHDRQGECGKLADCW